MSDSSPISSEPNESPVAIVDSVVNELVASNYSAIPNLFAGMSEPRRNAFRKEYLKRHSLYGTVHSIEASWEEIRQDPMAMFKTSRTQLDGAILLDLAIGNRDEILYAIRPAVKIFPDLVIPILQQRDITKLIPAITKSLLADRSESFPVWALLVHNDLIPMNWDDRTVEMICESGFFAGPGSILALTENHQRWDELAYRMCEVDNYMLRSVVTGSRVPLDYIDRLNEAGRLDRIKFLRAALSGMHLVKNQNHSKSCEMIFDFLSPTMEELANCQADLCAVLDLGKPVSFGFVLDKMEKLLAHDKIDWSIVLSSLGALFSRAGIAQAKIAIKILQGSLSSPMTRDDGCNALTQALLHSKREVGEHAWKALLPTLSHLPNDGLQSIVQIRPMLTGTLGKTVSDFLASRNTDDSPLTGDQNSTSNLPNADNLSWEAILDQLKKIPIPVRRALRCREAFESSVRAELATSFDWGIQNAAVLQSCHRLEPIRTLDELVLRIGQFGYAHDVELEELDLILDGICRIPRSNDSQFQSKTAAIKNNAKKESPEGLSNPFIHSDFAHLLLGWLGEPIPSNVNRYVQSLFDERAHFVVASAIPWVAEGRGFQLTSTPTHRGGWIDPSVWLDRLEAAQASGESLLLADIELALMRLAPDGRTTPIRNNQLLQRARRLNGAHALMVQYAMGETVSWEDMAGSKRLWIASIRSRDPSVEIPTHASFAKGIEDHQSLRPANWKLGFHNELGDFARPKACVVSIEGGELRRWMPKELSSVALGHPFNEPNKSPDNIFLTHFLISQVRERNESTPYRNYQPHQLDWYWNSLLNNLILRSTKKDELLSLDSGTPWLEEERPLTYESAVALWMASLTKGDRSKIDLERVWSNLVETDRLNQPLLLQAARDILPFDWCVAKRWGEMLRPVASRSDLHAWEIGRLALGLLCSVGIDQKDALGFVEIVLQSYTTLNIRVTPAEVDALNKYASGKCKKAIQEIFLIQNSAMQKRKITAMQKVMIRIQRALRWANATPSEFSAPIQLSLEDVNAERIDSIPSSQSELTNTASPGTQGVVLSPAASLGASSPEASPKSLKSSATKKSVSDSKVVPLGRSHEAMRLLRSAIPGFARLPVWGYYVGSERSYLDSIDSGHSDPEDHYQVFLMSHLGFPVSKSPAEVTQLLRDCFNRLVSDSNRDWSMAWLAALATALTMGDHAVATQLLDRLDVNSLTGYGEPSGCALAIAAMAASGLRSSPLQIPNSLQLQIDKEKKLSHFLEVSECIRRGDETVFVKSFENCAKKAANDIGKIIKGNVTHQLWWPSALLTVLWHSAKHQGMDCSKVGTQYMALVPSVSTLEQSSDTDQASCFPLPENRDQQSLELLDRLLESAGIRYALIRPRIDKNRYEPYTTEWDMVVDSRDREKWNRLFATYNPEELMLNPELCENKQTDYQVVFAAIPQYGAIFRRLNVPDAMIDPIFATAERRDTFGTPVTLTAVEEAVGLLMPLLDQMESDPKLKSGKMQNVSYFRRRWVEYKSWIVRMLEESDRDIIWPKIQQVAKQLKAENAVNTIKSSYQPRSS